MTGRSLCSAALLLAACSGFLSATESEVKNVDTSEPPARDVATSRAPTEKSAIIAPEAAEPGRAKPRRTRILFITADDCQRCEREIARLSKPGGDFETLQARGWKIGDGAENHLQIVNRDEIPELVSQLDVREFPTVACVSDGEIVRSFKDGCTTPLDVWTFGFLLKGQNERPAGTVSEPARVKSTGSYRLRGNHWSIDGDWNPSLTKLVTHLRGSNHGGQLQANWAIESWSYEELRSLHDDLHERELANGTVSYTSGSYQYQSGPRVPSEYNANRKFAR